MPRQANGRSSIYQGTDGKWHGRVSVGIKENGRPDRRHVEAKTKAEVTRKVRDVERKRDNGELARTGDNWTVKGWLEYWLEEIAAPFLRPNTVSGYRVAVGQHLVPLLGEHKLAKLRPEHLERAYSQMLAKTTVTGSNLRPATVHHAHRTIRVALNEAVRRGYLTRNPATLAKAPRVEPIEIEPYSVDEIRKILATALHERNGSRWAVALALGLRQGEALGLKWEDIDWTAGRLHVRRSRVRPKYAHGCGSKPCGQKPGMCPRRRLIVPKTDETKTRSGRRIVGLPPALLDLLRHQRSAQDEERKLAAQLWVDEGWVFASPTGAALSPWTDWSHWKALLKKAGVRTARLHDARHTAATVLMLLGVHERPMMGLMGWSHTAMAHRYAHMVDPIRDEVAMLLEGLIWPTTPDDTPPHEPTPLGLDE